MDPGPRVKKMYHYEGCVLVHDRVVQHYFKADTMAVSPKKALSNIRYQFIQAANYVATVPVKLPGKLTEIN